MYMATVRFERNLWIFCRSLKICHNLLVNEGDFLIYMQSSCDWRKKELEKAGRNLTEDFLLQYETVRWKSIHKKKWGEFFEHEPQWIWTKGKKNIIYDYEEILN